MSVARQTPDNARTEATGALADGKRRTGGGGRVVAGPLGLLAFGPLVDAFGPAVGFAMIGGGCVLAAAVAAVSGGLRGLGRPARGTELPPDSVIRQSIEG